MGEAKAIALAAFSLAIGCTICAPAGAPAGSGAAILPALTISEVEVRPADARKGGYNGLWHQAQGLSGLTMIVDDATGIRLGIPFGIVGSPTRNRADGSNWKSFDRRLQIDTFRSFGRTLGVQKSKLYGSDKRNVTRDYDFSGGFILEGDDDNDKSRFYLEVHSRDGEIRGLSIVHTTRFGGELYQVIEDIKRSFAPFPGVSGRVEQEAALKRAREREDADRQAALKRAEEDAARRAAQKRAEDEAARQAAQKRAEDEAARQAAQKRADDEAAKKRAEEEDRKGFYERWRQLLTWLEVLPATPSSCTARA